MHDGAVALDETIHQPTRLQVMTLLAYQPGMARVAYGLIQKSLALTGGNLTVHLRKLEEAGYVATTKEFVGSRPRTWVQLTAAGQHAFAQYLGDLERALPVSFHHDTSGRPHGAQEPTT